MMVSTRGRYALRVLIDLAENDNGTFVTMKSVAERQEISQKYLEKIMHLLVSQNMVEGIHGKGGGYRLTRDPSEYKVSEILKLTEGELAPVACLAEGAEPCPRSSKCRTLPMWIELDRRINEYLDSVTVADLMKK